MDEETRQAFEKMNVGFEELKTCVSGLQTNVKDLQTDTKAVQTEINRHNGFIQTLVDQNQINLFRKTIK